MAEFSFGLAESSFLQLNDKKHSRSVAEDLKSNKQKRTKRIYQERRRHGKVITLSDFYSVCENKYYLMKTSSV